MIKQTLITLVAVSTAVYGGASNAESFTENEKRSYTKVTSKNLVGACVDAIEDYYDKEAGLSLNRRGNLIKDGETRSYRIDGWIWRNGSRAEISHNCTANTNGKGLFVDVSYPRESEFARNEAEQDHKS